MNNHDLEVDDLVAEVRCFLQDDTPIEGQKKWGGMGFRG